MFFLSADDFGSVWLHLLLLDQSNVRKLPRCHLSQAKGIYKTMVKGFGTLEGLDHHWLVMASLGPGCT